MSEPQGTKRGREGDTAERRSVRLKSAHLVENKRVELEIRRAYDSAKRSYGMSETPEEFSEDPKFTANDTLRLDDAFAKHAGAQSSFPKPGKIIAAISHYKPARGTLSKMCASAREKVKPFADSMAVIVVLVVVFLAAAFFRRQYNLTVGTEEGSVCLASPADLSLSDDGAPAFEGSTCELNKAERSLALYTICLTYGTMVAMTVAGRHLFTLVNRKF
eukprot:CAMPEP_0167791766 /NCGR_PEP_ID=MMETSP0111_2-20121227/12132_1 /TAXON_ID=91324 /ORGANISM="Lotharella globosa, Strain CCCM811" /LENGTH=217 /DNA_ID=CAMNT_0007684499 /DNA_START=35 /DNA_END=688 /DNA_ORIENTATION=+